MSARMQSSPLGTQRAMQERNPFAPILSSPVINTNRRRDASCQTPKDLMDSKYKRPYLELLKTIKQLQDKHSERIQKLASEISVLNELLRTKKVEIQALESLRGHHQLSKTLKKTKDAQVQTNILKNEGNIMKIHTRLRQIHGRVFDDSNFCPPIDKILQDIERLLSTVSLSEPKKGKEYIDIQAKKESTGQTPSSELIDDQKGVNWDHLLHKLSLITPTKKGLKLI